MDCLNYELKYTLLILLKTNHNWNITKLKSDFFEFFGENWLFNFGDTTAIVLIKVWAL